MRKEVFEFTGWYAYKTKNLKSEWGKVPFDVCREYSNIGENKKSKTPRNKIQLESEAFNGASRQLIKNKTIIKTQDTRITS